MTVSLSAAGRRTCSISPSHTEDEAACQWRSCSVLSKYPGWDGTFAPRGNESLAVTLHFSHWLVGVRVWKFNSLFTHLFTQTISPSKPNQSCGCDCVLKESTAVTTSRFYWTVLPNRSTFVMSSCPSQTLIDQFTKKLHLRGHCLCKKCNTFN